MDKAGRAVGEVVGGIFGRPDVGQGRPTARITSRSICCDCEYTGSDAGQRPSGKWPPAAAPSRALIFVGLLLCGIYMRYRQRGPLASLTRLIVLLLLAIAAVGRWPAGRLRPTPGAANWCPCCCSA